MREWGLTPPQWRELDEADRDLMLAESALVCGACGNLRSVCSREGVQWYPVRSECFATAAQELTIRRLRDKYDSERGTTGLHPLDGVSVSMSEHDVNPEDDFFD